VIVVPSLSHEFEPWQWTTYMPTWVDWCILLGSFGWFFMWFLLFIKQLPVLALAEIKEIVPPKLRHAHAGAAHHQAIEHGGMASAQNNDAGHTDRGVR
jgi:molybdopterin-containing oxidoreductase family membrane subunit